MVRFNLTSGTMKTVYWKYASCPNEQVDVVGPVCTGWCVLSWLRKYSGNLGRADYVFNGELRVPYGSGEEPDKRRAGMWYLGLQALEGAAEYTIETESTAPVIHVKYGCNRIDRYCADEQRVENLEVTSSAARRGGRGAAWAAPALLLPWLLCRRTAQSQRWSTGGLEKAYYVVTAL